MKPSKSILLFVVIILQYTYGICQTSQNDLTEEWEMEYFRRQPPDRIMAAIGIKPGMTIGEIGAGRGRFTVYMARENFKLSVEYNPSNQAGQYVLKNLDEIFDQTHPKK